MSHLTQQQVFETLGSLLQYVVADVQDLSKVEFTASDMTITGVDNQGKRAAVTIPYAEGGN